MTFFSRVDVGVNFVEVLVVVVVLAVVKRLKWIEFSGGALQSALWIH